MFVDEACDAVQQGVCMAAGANLAMKLGVDDPAGPLAGPPPGTPRRSPR